MQIFFSLSLFQFDTNVVFFSIFFLVRQRERRKNANTFVCTYRDKNRGGRKLRCAPLGRKNRAWRRPRGKRVEWCAGLFAHFSAPKKWLIYTVAIEKQIENSLGSRGKESWKLSNNRRCKWITCGVTSSPVCVESTTGRKRPLSDAGERFPSVPTPLFFFFFLLFVHPSLYCFTWRLLKNAIE